MLRNCRYKGFAYFSSDVSVCCRWHNYTCSAGICGFRKPKRPVGLFSSCSLFYEFHVLLSEKIYCGNALQLRIEGDIFVRFSPGARSGGAVIMFARGITCRLCGLERVGTRSWSLEHRYGGMGGAVPKSLVLLVMNSVLGTTPINWRCQF